LVVGIIFDLNEKRVYCDHETIRAYDKDKSPYEFKLLKIQGGNNKAIYTTVEPQKLIQLYKTFFGKLKKNEKPVKGELLEMLEKNQNKPYENLKGILQEIFLLRESFLALFLKEGETEKLDLNKLVNEYKLGVNDNIVFIYTCVISNKFSYNKPKPISQIDDYIDFISTKFLDNDEVTLYEKAEKLCYASGDYHKDVEELNLSTRYSLNKMFVTETKNYANLFDKKNFRKNYQLSQENQVILDLASTYLLKNYKVKIAGLDHVIVP